MAPRVWSLLFGGGPPFFLGGWWPRRSYACCHLSARCGRALTVLSPLLTGSTDTIPMDVEGRRSARAVGVVAPLAETVTLMGRNPNGLWSLPKTVRVAVVRSPYPRGQDSSTESYQRYACLLACFRLRVRVSHTRRDGGWETSFWACWTGFALMVCSSVRERGHSLAIFCTLLRIHRLWFPAFGAY